MKFDSKLLLEQLIRDELFEQKLSNKIPKSAKKKKNDVDSEDFKIVAWTDAKLNNKATFYTNKLKETDRVPGLTSGWLNGFTVITKHEETPSNDSFVDRIRQNTKYGENSKYANGDHIYIYFTKQLKQIAQKVVNRQVVDIVILPLDKVSLGKKQKPKKDDIDSDLSDDLPPLKITDKSGKEFTYTREYILKQKDEEEKKESKIRQDLETKHEIKFNDDQIVTLMDLYADVQYEDGVDVIASRTPMLKIGQSKYMSFVKFKDGSYINENSINSRKQVMQEQEQWKSPEYRKTPAQVKADKWATPEPPKTTVQIASKLEEFDTDLMTITGDMESNYTIKVNTTRFNEKYTTPTDTEVITQISDLNKKLLALVLKLRDEYEKSGNEDSELYKLMNPARSYGANIETGDGLLGFLPGGGLGVNFGDDEKYAARLFNAWWGGRIKYYNTNQASESDAVRQNLIIQYNERVLTKLYEWTMSQIKNGENETFTGEFVKINTDGTWDSFRNYSFTWEAI